MERAGTKYTARENNMMTRMDFELMAKSFKAGLDSFTDSPEFIAQPTVAYHFADGYGAAVRQLTIALKKSNPRFDEKRFLKACGVEER